MKKLLLGVVLSLLLIALGYTAQSEQSQGEGAVLIIGGPGINSDIYGKDQQLLYHIYQMFNAASQGFKPINIQFKGDQARTQKGVSFAAALNNQESMNGAAQRVGEIAAENNRSVLMLDMDLHGVDIAAAKGLVVPLEVTNRMAIPIVVADRLDSVRTRWNSETERAAVFIEQAAREFKRIHGDKAKVIVVGHSAFTNAIDLVPLKDGKKQLIDFRIMSSPMVRNFKYHDPEHTVIVTHENDLPSANMGNIWSSRSMGDLAREGTVLRLKGIPSDVWWKPIVPDSLKWISAHSQTHYYTRVFDMDVLTNKGIQPFRGTPGDIIKKQMAAVNEGRPVATTVIQTLQREAPKESRVGGVSLSKPAEVPLDPADIRELRFQFPYTVWSRGVPYEGFSFLMKSGEKIYLPQLDPVIEANAVLCVYNDVMVMPEISISSQKDDEGITWKLVDYKKGQDILPYTRLGHEMLDADRFVGDLAFGNTDTYRPPPTIKNYHPYFELALDNKLFMGGKRGIRAWLVPSVIRTELYVDRLQYEEIRMAYRFEAFDLADSERYFAGQVQGYSDPAGEFLSAQLTDNYKDLEVFFPELVRLREIAGFTGIIIWARQNKIPINSSSLETALRVSSENRIMPGENNLLQVKRFRGDRCYVHRNPVGVESTPKLKDVKRPTPVFNEFGLSRLLWTDGNETEIEYDENGRIKRLIGRQKDATNVLYDRQGRPVAIADSEGNGMAVFYTMDIPILSEGVLIDRNSYEVVLNKGSKLRPEGDVGGFFATKIAEWIAAQSSNNPTAVWLRPAGRLTYLPRVSLRFWLFALTSIFIFGLLVIFIRRFRPTGSFKTAWALQRLRYGIGFEKPKRAAETLAKSKDPQVVAALIKRIKKGRATIDAFDALVKIGAPAVEPLISLLKDQDKHMQWNAAKALGEIGDPQAVEPLRVVLSEEGYSIVWDAAVEALGKIGNTQCIRILENELQHPREECRWKVIDSLVETRKPVIVEPLIKALGDKESSVRRCAVHALRRFGDVRAVPPLLSAALADQDIEMRQEAAKALGALGWQPEDLQMNIDLAFALRDWDELGKLGSPAVDRLIGELQGKEYGLRVEVAKTLGKIGDVRAVQPLVAALSDDGVGLIREAALKSLEWIGPNAATPLIAVLNYQKPYVRKAVVETLGKLGKASLEGLKIALEDPEFEVQQAAVSALGNIKDPQASALLAEIIHKSSDFRLRQKAALAFGGQDNDTLAIACLMKILHDDPDPNVRKAAISALRQMRNKKGVVEALKDEDLDICAFARSTLNLMGWKPKNDVERGLFELPYLIATLHDLLDARIPFQWSDQAMKRQKEAQLLQLVNVIQQLGRIRDRRAVKHISLALKHENVAVRKAADDALSQLNAT
jgi:HEAT repeat protein